MLTLLIPQGFREDLHPSLTMNERYGVATTSKNFRNAEFVGLSKNEPSDPIWGNLPEKGEPRDEGLKRLYGAMETLIRESLKREKEDPEAKHTALSVAYHGGAGKKMDTALMRRESQRKLANCDTILYLITADPSDDPDRFPTWNTIERVRHRR